MYDTYRTENCCGSFRHFTVLTLRQHVHFHRCRFGRQLRTRGSREKTLRPAHPAIVRRLPSSSVSAENRGGASKPRSVARESGDTPPTCSFSSVPGILYLEGKDVEQNKHCSTTSVQGAMDCQGAHVCARDLRTSMRSSMSRAFMARSTSGALGYFL